MATGAQHDGAGSQQGSGQQALFFFLKQSKRPASADEGVNMPVRAIAAASVSTFCMNEVSVMLLSQSMKALNFVSQKHDSFVPKGAKWLWKSRTFLEHSIC